MNLGKQKNSNVFAWFVPSIPDVKMICQNILLHILEVLPRKRASFAIWTFDDLEAWVNWTRVDSPGFWTGQCILILFALFEEERE